MKKGYAKEAPKKNDSVKKGYDPTAKAAVPGVKAASPTPTNAPGQPPTKPVADEPDVKKGYDTSNTKPVTPSTEADQATKSNLADPEEQTDKSAPKHVKREVSKDEFLARMAAGRLKSKAKSAAVSATAAATAK